MLQDQPFGFGSVDNAEAGDEVCLAQRFQRGRAHVKVGQQPGVQGVPRRHRSEGVVGHHHHCADRLGYSRWTDPGSAPLAVEKQSGSSLASCVNVRGRTLSFVSG